MGIIYLYHILCNTNILQKAMHTMHIKCNTIDMEVYTMSFKIKPDKKESENKTIRFPLELVQDIEKAIKNKNVTFSSFVIQACRFALDNMDEKKK